MAQMQAPTPIEVKSLGDYLEVMSKAVFQSGMSWKVIESKWPQLREAMRNFDVDSLATLSTDDLEELAHDTRVIRNRRKLAAIVHNAQRMIDLDEAHGGFQNYLRSHSSFELTTKDLRKQFKFMGDMGCYFFLYIVGENVPSHEDWVKSRETKARS